MGSNSLRVGRTWGYAALLVAAVALLYGRFLANPLLFDDMQFFVPGSAVFPGLAAFAPFQIRWLPYASIAWSADLFGASITCLRIEALLLHGAVGMALFFMTLRLHQTATGAEAQREHALPVTALAFCAALLFVLHPAAVYGAGYLVQRTIVMATLFSLLALLAYLRGLASGKTAWLWLGVLFYALAVLSKEHAVMLPAVMLALTVLAGKTAKPVYRKLPGIYLACLSVALFVLAQKYGILGAIYEDSAPQMVVEANAQQYPYPLSILTQCWLFFKYLSLWLLPNPAWMSADMREPLATGLFSRYGLACIAFAGYGALAIRLLFKRGNTGLFGFAMLFPWLLFFTEFATVRIQEPFVLYRSYLWMAGIFVSVPLALARLERRRAAWVMAVLALALAAFSVDRLTTFSQRFLLWDDAAKLLRDEQYAPGADRIYANRAKSLKELGRHQEAVLDYRHAIALRPNFANYHHGVAIVYLEMRDFARAIDEFGLAIALDPQHKLAYYGRGTLYLHLGQEEAARRDLAMSCSLGWQPGCARRKQIGG